MKLSEAIILGSVSTTQRFDDNGVGDELCVIQTAVYAIGKKYGPCRMYLSLWEAWRWTEHYMAIHPVTGERKDITRTLYNLNDQYHWPRPQIAEWVKTIEPVEVPTPTTEEVLHEVV